MTKKIYGSQTTTPNNPRKDPFPTKEENIANIKAHLNRLEVKKKNFPKFSSIDEDIKATKKALKEAMKRKY